MSIEEPQGANSRVDAAPPVFGPVRSDNEWDPLEEVIVGVVDGAAVPPWDLGLESAAPAAQAAFFREHGGRPWPRDEVRAAAAELDHLAAVLEAEGVVVRRPAARDFSLPYATPAWRQACGLYAAMPRDVLLVVGDIVIEAPMAWRARLFEPLAYRELVKAYFRGGARWCPAPRPELADALYDPDFSRDPADPSQLRHAVTEHEPVFDAADFIRLGSDILAQRSHVTNRLGIEWVRRCLGPAYRVHEHRYHDLHPMHLDATIMPLAPGRALVNPERLRDVPAPLAGWELLPAPPSTIPPDYPLRLSSSWIAMNVLSLDPQRVVVEAHEEPLIRALRAWGFQPIAVPFRNFNRFGGSLHCATVDVRRRAA